MDYELTAAQKDVQALIKKVCAENLVSVSDRKVGIAREEELDLLKKNLKTLAAAGAFGFMPPEEIVSFCVAGEEIAKTCTSTFLTVASSVFAGGLVKMFGTPEQQAKYLVPMSKGDLIGSLAVTEEGSGSDLGGICTAGTLSSGQWVLNGKKTFVTNAPIADVFLVLARTSQEGGLKEALSFFIVERGAKGLTIGEPIETLGLQGAAISEIELADCVVYPTAMLGTAAGEGAAQYDGVMPLIYLGMAAYAVGVGTACMEESTRYAKKREAFGKAIGYFEGVGAKLATMFTSLDLGRMLMCRAAWGIERRDSDAAILAACAKLFTSESVNKVADLTMQIHAGHGYRTGSRVERLYRDARFAEIAYTTSEILRGIIANDALDRFKPM